MIGVSNMSNVTGNNDELTIESIGVTPDYTIAAAWWPEMEWDRQIPDPLAQSIMKDIDDIILNTVITDHDLKDFTPSNNRSVKKTRRRRAKNRAACKARRKNRK